MEFVLIFSIFCHFQPVLYSSSIPSVLALGWTPLESSLLLKQFIFSLPFLILTKISLNLQVNKDIPIPTKNRNFITLKNGAFYNSQYSNLFLCEWRDNISSSN